MSNLDNENSDEIYTPPKNNENDSYVGWQERKENREDVPVENQAKVENNPTENIPVNPSQNVVNNPQYYQQGYNPYPQQQYNPYPQNNPYVQGNQYAQQNPYQQYQGSPYPQQQYNQTMQNGGSYYRPPLQEKPKKSVGAKVFVSCILTIISISLVAVVWTYMQGIQDNTVDSYDDFSSQFSSDDNNGYYYNDDDESSDDGSSSEDSNIETDTSGLIIPDIDTTYYGSGITLESVPTTEELEPQEVYEKVIASTVSIVCTIVDSYGTETSSSGTGVFITEDGFILTNSHVINDTKTCQVLITTYDGIEYYAVVVGYDKTNDLAVLKVDADGFEPVEFGDSDDLEMGQWVMAIGNPGGLSGSITRGVVSGLNRSLTGDAENSMTYIQTDAAINPGNSGGPLVNMYGQVVGINTSKIVADYYEGIGFSIPSSSAESIINDLLTQGYVSGRVRLGITATNITDYYSTLYGIPVGVMVVSISDDSSFYGTEVKVNDIIVTIDGKDAEDLDNLSLLFLAYSPGDEVEVEIYRINTDGSVEEFTVTITLIEDQGETQD